MGMASAHIAVPTTAPDGTVFPADVFNAHVGAQLPVHVDGVDATLSGTVYAVAVAEDGLSAEHKVEVELGDDVDLDALDGLAARWDFDATREALVVVGSSSLWQ
jgi:hypothetical protein